MVSILQRIKLATKVSNRDGAKNDNGATTYRLFDEEDERTLERLSFEEQVLYKAQKMYSDPRNGLFSIFRELGEPTPVVPQRTINIFIVGNHSSGKSTFINWYVGEQVQKTGMAMETSKFTVVCHGKRRETLTSGAVVKLFPSLQAFEKIAGGMHHLSGEISTSTKNRFGFVNFIDSPGMVDDERYNFDFDRGVEICAEIADLILVFFDSHGQALCQRTLTHLERLCISHPNKLSLWMTKCDMVKDEGDLVKVTQQIYRALARRPVIAQQELWLTPIYVPGHSDNQPAGLNRLPAVKTLIDKSIAANLQNNIIRNIIQQCDYLEKLNTKKHVVEENRRLQHFSKLVWLQVFLYLIIMVTVVVIGFSLVDSKCLANHLKTIVDPKVVVDAKIRFHKSLASQIQPQMEMPVLAGVLLCISVLAWVAALEPPAKPVKKHSHVDSLSYRSNIEKINNIRQEADQLFRDYLNLTLDI